MEPIPVLGVKNPKKFTIIVGISWVDIACTLIHQKFNFCLELFGDNHICTHPSGMFGIYWCLTF